MIVAHNQFELLKLLLSCLDHPQNDFYIHIDKKCKNVDFEGIKNSTCYSGLKFVNRISVSWGAFSLVEAELVLLKAAVQGDYDYYHLISGEDLPIKSNETILEFFENHKGFEFVHFSSKEYCNSFGSERRIKYYYPLQQMFGKEIGLYGAFSRAFVKVQRFFGVDRLKGSDLKIVCGSQWFSITKSLAGYVLENEDLVRKLCRKSFCVDEVFLQTLVYNSDFIERVYHFNDSGDYTSSLRYIDWNRGNPYTFSLEDYDELIGSKCLFARKFNILNEPEVCYAIAREIGSGEKSQ